VIAVSLTGYLDAVVVEGGIVPTLSQRISRFLSSPQGQRVIQQGRQQLAKPENQQKLRALLSRMQKRR
jgi:hypothetical protein